MFGISIVKEGIPSRLDVYHAACADNSDAPSYGPSPQATYPLDDSYLLTRQAMTFTGTGLTWQAPLSPSLRNVSYPPSNPVAFAWVRRSKERSLASSSLRFKGEAK